MRSKVIKLLRRTAPADDMKQAKRLWHKLSHRQRGEFRKEWMKELEEQAG